MSFSLSSLLRCLIITLGCMLMTIACSAAVIRLSPVDDGFLRTTQSSAETRRARQHLVLVGDTEQPGDAFRGVLRFDLSDLRLEGGTLTQATLSLKVLRRDDSASREETLHLHLLEKPIDLKTADWRYFAPGEKWSQAGGDFGPSLAQRSVNPAKLNFNETLALSGEAFVEALQPYLGGEATVLLKLEEENSERSVLRLNAEACRLELEYIPSETAAAALAKMRAPLPGQSGAPSTNVVPVPGHPERSESPRYALYAGGHAVEVKDEAFDFDVAMLTMGESPVLVDVMVMEGFDRYTLKPDRHGIDVERIGDVLRFTLEAPHDLVLQIPGRKPLALIVTPLEAAVPSPADPNVLYFAPGVTEAGVIRPESGQTIYMAPGALVKGRIEASGVQDVKVRGRGLLETKGYSIRKKKLHGILFDHCQNVLVEGIGVRSNDTWWQTLFLNTINAEVAHVNLFGIGVNTDGVDIDAVKNFTVRDSFIRCEDDGLGWHALDAEANGEMITENALAENVVIWNTRAGNGIRIGASMEAQLWRNITIRDVDILQHAKAGIYSDYSDWALIENLRFENITIERPTKPIDFYIARTGYSNWSRHLDERGHFDGLLFENVKMRGGRIRLRGYDARHRIHAVRFNNCTNAGKPVDSMDDVRVNAFVTDLRFNEPLPEKPVPLPGVFEAEALESRISGGAQYIADNPEASAGRSRVFLPRESGAFIEHGVPIPEAGHYSLSISVRASPELGRAELSLNGEVIATELELRSVGERFKVLEFRSVSVEEPGLVPLRLTLPNVEGDGEALLALDAIVLKKR